MALTRNRIQVQFSAANSATLLAGGSLASDAVALSANAVARELVLDASPASAAAAGDDIEGHWLGTGDPDGNATTTDDTDGTVTINLPVEDAADHQKRVGLGVVEPAGKLRLDSAVSVDCTISAEIIEILSS